MDDIILEGREVVTIGSGADTLLRLFRERWEHETFPTERKHSVITPIHKKNKLDYENYRGISLLCQNSKIFSSIFLQRIKGRNPYRAPVQIQS